MVRRAGKTGGKGRCVCGRPPLSAATEQGGDRRSENAGWRGSGERGAAAGGRG